MACRCQTRSDFVPPQAEPDVKAVLGVGQAGEQVSEHPGVGRINRLVALPHEVLPSDSCIYCAFKHASTAKTELAAAGYLPLVIGELELARRHTALDYKEVAALAAEAELSALSPDKGKLADMVGSLCESIQTRIADDSSDSESVAVAPGGGVFTYTRGYRAVRRHYSTNPLKAGVHLCAAWRLATEIGYMGSNRAMIIGDLALAREHIIRFDIELSDHCRELRHRVETARCSDLDPYWVHVLNLFDRRTAGKVEELWRDCSQELEAWLLPDKQVSDKDETRK